MNQYDGLTPEEVESLGIDLDGQGEDTLEEEGDTEAEAKEADENGDSQPPAEDSAEPNGVTATDTETDTKPVGILTKDGKHVIPYSELEAARLEANEATVLRAKLKQYEQAEEPSKPEPVDPYKELRGMSETELEEAYEVGTLEERVAIRAYERQRVKDEVRAEAQREIAVSQVADFNQKWADAWKDNPELQAFMDFQFVNAQTAGKSIPESLATAEAAARKLGLFKETSAPDPKAAARQLLETKKPRQTPRTLSGVGERATSRNLEKRLTDLTDLDNTESVLGEMTEEELSRWLQSME